MTHIDTSTFKKKLEDELEQLKKELATVGRINPDNPKDWEPTPADMDTFRGDPNEVADSIGAYEGNTAILKQLEIRYNEVKSALERIDNGTYGVCEVSGEPIETKRLEANPAARTCMKHMEG